MKEADKIKTQELQVRMRHATLLDIESKKRLSRNPDARQLNLRGQPKKG